MSLKTLTIHILPVAAQAIILVQRNLKMVASEISRSVRAAESIAQGKSIFAYDPKGKVSEAYQALTREVIRDAEKRRKHEIEQLR